MPSKSPREDIEDIHCPVEPLFPPLICGSRLIELLDFVVEALKPRGYRAAIL